MIAVRKIAIALALLGFAGVPCAVRAQGEGALTPPPGEMPTPVRLGLWLVDVSSIDEISSTFVVEMDVISSWTDSRLAFEAGPASPGPRIYEGGKARELMASQWSPLGQAVNAVGPLTPGRETLTIHPDGQVVFEARLQATLRAPLEFRRFPFDRQVLPIQVESFAWDESLVRFEPNLEHCGFAEGFDLQEWHVRGFEAKTSTEPRGRGERRFSRLTFELSVERRAGFYLWRILAPLVIIVLMSCVVFWMKGERLARRAGVSSTGMLTVIAYQFVVAGTLPRVPYLTLMDHFVLASLLSISATMVINVVVDRLFEQAERAARVDRAARWLFPLAYFAVLAIISARARLF